MTELKHRSIMNFVYDSWRFTVSSIEDKKNRKWYHQIFTFLGHVPLISDQDGKREEIIQLLRVTPKVGSCRVITNDNQMIFLLGQSKAKKESFSDPKAIILQTTDLLCQATPLLKIYRRYLSSN